MRIAHGWMPSYYCSQQYWSFLKSLPIMAMKSLGQHPSAPGDMTSSNVYELFGVFL